MVFQIGLGEMPGVVDFHESILSETSSFVLPNENSKYLKSKNRILLQKSQNSFKSIPTQVTTIDDFVKENKIIDIDILKIDVEGFEFEVMLGAKKVLGDGKVKIVQFERHTNDMRTDQFHEIDRFLKSLNYFKVKELKHPFGDFYELIYQKQ